MDIDPVFLSRLQFAFVITFHIIFPAFTIGLAAWLATLEVGRQPWVVYGLLRTKDAVTPSLTTPSVPNGRHRRTLGRVGPRRRRRHRRLEVAPEVQLSGPQRHDADGRRRRVLRRCWRQLLRARRRQRPEALGPGARRRDRRRRDHLYGERCAKSCCGGRLYAPGLANEDRDRKDRGAGLGQRLREPVRAPPGASPAIPSHGRSSTLLRCALGTRWSWLPGLPMFSPSSKTENPGPDGFTAYARWFGPAISPMGSEPPGRFG